MSIEIIERLRQTEEQLVVVAQRASAAERKLATARAAWEAIKPLIGDSTFNRKGHWATQLNEALAQIDETEAERESAAFTSITRFDVNAVIFAFIVAGAMCLVFLMTSQ